MTDEGVTLDSAPPVEPPASEPVTTGGTDEPEPPIGNVSDHILRAGSGIPSEESDVNTIKEGQLTSLVEANVVGDEPGTMTASEVNAALSGMPSCPNRATPPPGFYDIGSDIGKPDLGPEFDPVAPASPVKPLAGFTPEQVAEGQAWMASKTDRHGNLLIPAEMADGTIVMVSPIPPSRDADPFPEFAFDQFVSVVQGALNRHGGYMRSNPDGTVSFKPKSYVGPVVTAANKESLGLS